MLLNARSRLVLVVVMITAAFWTLAFSIRLINCTLFYQGYVESTMRYNNSLKALNSILCQSEVNSSKRNV